jgi:hypothetical protein
MRTMTTLADSAVSMKAGGQRSQDIQQEERNDAIENATLY